MMEAKYQAQRYNFFVQDSSSSSAFAPIKSTVSTSSVNQP
jgi:hypothetical protein